MVLLKETNVEVDPSTAIHWKDAVARGIRGVVLKGLHPKMLEEEGMVALVGKESDGVYILYDQEYVLQTIHDRILEPLGLISNQGKVKEKYLTTELVPAIITYANDTATRDQEKRAREVASLMSVINGLSIEENLAKLEG